SKPTGRMQSGGSSTGAVRGEAATATSRRLLKSSSYRAKTCCGWPLRKKRNDCSGKSARLAAVEPQRELMRTRPGGRLETGGASVDAGVSGAENGGRTRPAKRTSIGHSVTG